MHEKTLTGVAAPHGTVESIAKAESDLEAMKAGSGEDMMMLEEDEDVEEGKKSVPEDDENSKDLEDSNDAEAKDEELGDVEEIKNPKLEGEEPEDEEEITHPLPALRFDWTNLSLSSSFAKTIRDHQRNCSLPLGDLGHRAIVGLGSDLHVWTVGLVNAMQLGVRIRSTTPWNWLDTNACRAPEHQDSALMCYFPHAELQCENDHETLRRQQKSATNLGIGNSKGEEKRILQRYKLSVSDLRAAGIEYLFSQMGPLVVQEAQRQMVMVFGEEQMLPSQLITVHIRWGDKKEDMELLPVSKYVVAARKLVRGNSSSVGIFLATEDPRAVQEFQQAVAPYNWSVYLDAYYQEFNSYHTVGYNNNPKMSKSLSGRPGFVALASVLVAMQANDFVLTTRSNWSRLMNELRKNIVDPRCDGCTRMIDLQPFEW
jgi:hypothetical protein